MTNQKSTIREIELNDDGSAICKFDIETGDILDLCNWNGGDLHSRYDLIADEEIYEHRLVYLMDEKGMTQADAMALLDAEKVAV